MIGTLCLGQLRGLFVLGLAPTVSIGFFGPTGRCASYIAWVT
jgi:hypothetical protein